MAGKNRRLDKGNEPQEVTKSGQSVLRKVAVMLAAGTISAVMASAQPANSPPPDGKPIAVDVHEGTSMAVSASPDGKWLAIDLQGSLWIVSAQGGTAHRITDYYNDARQPVWSPDGTSIAYFAYCSGNYDLWTIRPDGTDGRQLTNGEYDDRDPAWSPDGRSIAFASDRGGSYDIWTIDVASGTFRQISTGPREDRLPSWSPDGTRIAFAATHAGETSIWSIAAIGGEPVLLRAGDGATRLDAPSWGPKGQLAYVVQDGSGSELAIDGKPITGAENVFPFRGSWSGKALFYVSDGRIRRRIGTQVKTVDFTARLEVTRPDYIRAKRDFQSTGPRPVLGIAHPALSPDGNRIAFAALGNLYLVGTKGGVPQKLTDDSALDADPAWSPDGRSLVYSSDKGGGLPQLWIRDLTTGQDRQLTRIDTQPQAAVWSPDGKRIAFIDADGRWGVSGLCVVDVATGAITRLQPSLAQPGRPTWSPDGRYVVFSLSRAYSQSFREGCNLLYVVPADGKGAPFWRDPGLGAVLDTRGGGGPTWSPDGLRMAGIQDGLLKIWPVGSDATPLGPPRAYSAEISHSPSWSGDSRSILFQSADQLKIVDVDTGALRDIPLDFTYRLAVPSGRLLIHAGSLIDAVRDETQHDKDIVIEGNRIVAISDHDPALHRSAAQVVDGSGLTAIPGLIEHHAHVQKDFGANAHLAWLTYGITTVRDPGNQPYDGVEDREASEAGVRIGPRIFTTGPLLEWERVFYKMGIAVSGPAHLERELARAKALHYDLLKSYVRMPELFQRRIVEAAHAQGVPVATHEIFPAAYTGVDNTEHLGATSRRGYSPKQGPQARAYEDVIQLFGRSGRTLTPTNFGALTTYLEKHPEYRDDPRLSFYPKWAQKTVLQTEPGLAALRSSQAGSLASLKAIRDAGALIVAGTDSMIAINLHAEIASYVDAGFTPFEALQTATVNAAKALNLDAGTLEPGKLADIVLVAGDPRANIANSFKVKDIISNGNYYRIDDLMKYANYNFKR